jgi:AcrR family transcriptional regulator
MPTADDTPARLVAAATQLIADGGEEATSLRAVSRAARSNAAAVHYHFGGRDELLAAVIAAILGPVHRRRFELLDEARALAETVPAEVIASALVRPDLELLAELRPGRVRVARLLGQPAAPGSAVASVLDRHFETLAAVVVPMLDPAVAPDERRQRLRWVLAVSRSVLAAADGADDSDEARLVGFCAAGLGAVPTPVPPAGPPSKTAKTAKSKAAATKPKKRRKSA